jgi:hypothetical protein
LGQVAQTRLCLDLERCPVSLKGTFGIIAAITYRPVIRQILRHLKLAADPPPITAARSCQEHFAWAPS